MTTQNTGLQTTKVADIKGLVSKAAGPEELISLPQVKNAFIAIRQRAMGVSPEEATAQYEMEKMRFAKLVRDNAAIAKCDPFSLYNAWVEHGLSGGTLEDGECYIIPRAGKAEWQKGWKFKQRQISELKNVIIAHEPILVWSDEDFEFEGGADGIKVTKHGMKDEHAEGAYITRAYMPVEFDFGTIIYTMPRAEILKIRDTKSIPYQNYMKAMAIPPEQRQYEPKLTMWTTDEQEAFKKTMVHRAYKKIPKTKDNVPEKNRILDAKLAGRSEEEIDGSDLQEMVDEAFIDTPHEDVVHENVFKKKYETSLEIESILNEANSGGDMAALFLANQEHIEKDEDLKAKFQEAKLKFYPPKDAAAPPTEHGGGAAETKAEKETF